MFCKIVCGLIFAKDKPAVWLLGGGGAVGVEGIERAGSGPATSCGCSGWSSGSRCGRRSFLRPVAILPMVVHLATWPLGRLAVSGSMGTGWPVALALLGAVGAERAAGHRA